MNTTLKKIILDDNTSIFIEVLPNVKDEDYLEQVSFGDDIFGVEELVRGITGISRILKDAIDKAKPSEASVEFGLAAEVKEGKLLATLCGGTLKGNIKVILKWN